jgi:hypothetical protein
MVKPMDEYGDDVEAYMADIATEKANQKSSVVLYNSPHWQEVVLADGYTAQSIFDQVWEWPYGWFRLSNQDSTTLPCWVDEVDDDGITVQSYLITHKMIVEASLKVWLDIVSWWKKFGSEPALISLADWLTDLDANDVDNILQMACFDENRYS